MCQCTMGNSWGKDGTGPLVKNNVCEREEGKKIYIIF